MKQITKRFPGGVVANCKVDLDVRKGEIHALLGENGAGKTTLMNILCGLYHPDEGEIYINEERVILNSPRDALDHGIGMVHQHFKLVSNFTVAENISLGLRYPRFLLNIEGIENETRKLSKRYGLEVDPKTMIWQLPVGEQQRVEIIKTLYQGAEIIILDEPTAVLTPAEAERLFSTLREMTTEGNSIIFISHKLNEVMAISDRITVLRGGRVVATVDKEGTDERELAKMMVGREVFLQATRKKIEEGEIVLEVDDLCALNDRGLPALNNISFSIRRGEILGVVGIAGNGQRELADVIAGLRRATSGRILISGKDMTNCPPRQIIDEKVGYVPEDRLGTGLISNLSISDNLILKDYRRYPLSKGPFLDRSAISRFVKRLIEIFKITTPSEESPVKILSGGNLQRVLFAREVNSDCDLIIASYPARGLDVAAMESVRKTLFLQRAEGSAILLISEDLEETISISDRVAVIYGGKLVKIIPTEEAKLEDIGLMMAGGYVN